VILLRPGIVAGEVADDGTFEEREDWTLASSENVEKALRNGIERRGAFRIVEMPEISPEEGDLLEEHLALFDLLAGAAFEYPGDEMDAADARAWRHRVDRFDASVGEGLSFLADRTGADAALVTLGSCFLPSGRWKTTVLVSALLGEALPTGTTRLTLGVVDLRTGDLLWIDRAVEFGALFFDPVSDLREAEDAEDRVDGLLEDYPGLEAYAAKRSRR